MANAVKYSITGLTQSLKKGNLYIGIGEAGKGPSNTTMYYNGVTPALNGYTVYFYNPSQPSNISYRSASNDSELIIITNNLSNQDFTTISQCLIWYSTQSNYSCVNKDYENIVTDGLVLNLDAGFINSYPRSGATWSDITSNGYNGTLTNGPTYSSLNEGSIVFDGSNDYVIINSGSNILSNVNYTKMAWFYVTSFVTPNNIISSNGGGQHAFWLAAGNKLNAGHNGSWNTVVSTTTLSLNTWYFGAVTFNTTTGWNLYVNGASESTSVNLTTFTGIGDMSLGSYWGSNVFTGRISIAQVYNRVLSSTEILKNYQVTLPRFTGDNIITDGLVLYLDAGYTASYPGSGTTWKDISGYGNNGTLTNGPLYNSSNGGSISFDGVDDRVVSSSLQITNAITISFWMKTTTTDNLNAIICRDETGSNRFWNIIYRGSTLRYLDFVVWHTDGSFTELISTASVLDDGIWKNIVCTFDGTTSANNFKIYINGTLDKQSTPNSIGVKTNLTTNLTLGSLTNGSGWFFNGSLSQVLIYNKYFSDTEIQQNFNAVKSRYGL